MSRIETVLSRFVEVDLSRAWPLLAWAWRRLRR